jgi:5-methylcytosine-specific restriction enzyme A
MTQNSISPKSDHDRPDPNTRRVKPWLSWYRSPIWKAIKRHRLAAEPQCRECAVEGRTEPATHVDHVEPHQGEESLFMQYENTQSLCRDHHNAHRYQGYQERSGKAIK